MILPLPNIRFSVPWYGSKIPAPEINVAEAEDDDHNEGDVVDDLSGKKCGLREMVSPFPAGQKAVLSHRIMPEIAAKTPAKSRVPSATRCRDLTSRCGGM